MRNRTAFVLSLTLLFGSSGVALAGPIQQARTDGKAALLSCGGRIFEVKPRTSGPAVREIWPETTIEPNISVQSTNCRAMISAILKGAAPREIAGTATRLYAMGAEALDIRVLSDNGTLLGIPLVSPEQLGWDVRAAQGTQPSKPQQGGSDMVFVNAQPHPLFLTVGPDGAAWVEVRGFADNGSYLARLSPTLATFSVFPLFLADRDAFVGSASGLAIDGLQGAWVMGAGEDRVVRVSPFGEAERYDLPKQPEIAQHVSSTGQLASDAHDRIWFVQSASGQVGFLVRGKRAVCVAKIPGADQIVTAGDHVAVLNPLTGQLLILGPSPREAPCR